MYKEITGDIFKTRADALVNPVNCEGVMTTELGKEYKKRYPGMFDLYRKLCKSGMMQPGEILLFKSSRPVILSFGLTRKAAETPNPRIMEQILSKFAKNYWRLDSVHSVAFPVFDPPVDGMSQSAVAQLMRKYLEPLPINVEVYFRPHKKKIIETMH